MINILVKKSQGKTNKEIADVIYVSEKNDPKINNFEINKLNLNYFCKVTNF